MIWISYYPTHTNHAATGERGPKSVTRWQLRTACGLWLPQGRCELGITQCKTCSRCAKKAEVTP